MRTRSYLFMLTLVVLVGCAAEPTTVTTTTTTQEVTTTGPAREVVVTRAPPPVRLETQTGNRAGLRLDNRLLAMDRHDLRVGAGHLGRPPAARRSLARRPLAIAGPDAIERELGHQPRTFAKSNGATIVASDSITNRGVSTFSFPHVIFSFGTAPEYDPKLVVESLIWQKYPHSGTGMLTTS
jgi:hypothetical protein